MFVCLIVLGFLQQGDPIEGRYKESIERGPAIDQLVYCINSYREAALSKDPKFEHIDISDKQKVHLNKLFKIHMEAIFLAYKHYSICILFSICMSEGGQ